MSTSVSTIPGASALLAFMRMGLASGFQQIAIAREVKAVDAATSTNMIRAGLNAIAGLGAGKGAATLKLLSPDRYPEDISSGLQAVLSVSPLEEDRALSQIEKLFIKNKDPQRANSLDQMIGGLLIGTGELPMDGPIRGLQESFAMRDFCEQFSMHGEVFLRQVLLNYIGHCRPLFDYNGPLFPIIGDAPQRQGHLFRERVESEKRLREEQRVKLGVPYIQAESYRVIPKILSGEIGHITGDLDESLIGETVVLPAPTHNGGSVMICAVSLEDGLLHLAVNDKGPTYWARPEQVRFFLRTLLAALQQGVD